MADVRYALAVLLVVFALPPFTFWFLIHPFGARWRKRGAGFAYAVAGGAVVLESCVLYLLRGALVGPDLGTSTTALLLATLPFGLALWTGVAVRRRLPVDTQVGLPELAPERHPTALITDGVYAHLRHPRYVAAGLAFASLALVANHVGPYVVALLFVPLIHGVVLLEERELRQRFGAEYDAYSSRVPRYLPNFLTRRLRSLD